jgi:hypothetical protein
MNIKKSLRVVKASLTGKRIVHFLHIGKTGGTAIKYVLKRYPSTPEYEIFIHNHKTSLSDIHQSHGVIFFLRDPARRFVSAFYSRKREGKPRLYNPWSEGERRAFERFETPRDLAEALDDSDPDTRESAIDAMAEIGHIKNPYSQWLRSAEYLLSRRDDILFVGFQESFEEDFLKLKEILKLPQEASLPTDDINTHRNPQNVDKRLSDRALDNLKSWYRDDYALMRLCEKEFGSRFHS